MMGIEKGGEGNGDFGGGGGGGRVSGVRYRTYLPGEGPGVLFGEEESADGGSARQPRRALRCLAAGREQERPGPSHPPAPVRLHPHLNGSDSTAISDSNPIRSCGLEFYSSWIRFWLWFPVRQGNLTAKSASTAWIFFLHPCSI